MKFIRKLLIFTLAILAFSGLLFLKDRLTDGFSLYQMTSSLPPCPQYEVSLSPEEKEALQRLLDQPFHYLGKGCQFYAFESEDGKTVIKFLKHKHLRPYTWLQGIPLPSALREVADAKVDRRKERVERLFSSCKLAYEEMPELTGLLYIHLNRTPALEKEMMLVDKLGLRHRVHVDDYEFVVQECALPVKEVFADNLDQPEEIQKRVAQLMALIEARYAKGISDRDRSFVQNVAFAKEGERALFVDIGQFYKDEAILTEEAQALDRKKRLGNLRYWTGRFFPEVIDSIK